MTPGRLNLRGQRNIRRRPMERKRVTVCLAAGCNFGIANAVPFIVGASDRMITISEIEYEPDQTKVFPIASHTVVLLAGEMRLHSHVCPVTQRKLMSAQKVPLRVADIAEAYAEEFAEYRRRVAERFYLMPLGIRNARDFLFRQRDMAESEASALRTKMLEYMIDAPAIIAGVDDTGPHIYKVEDPGVATCYDLPYFCAAGAGAHHAESQFMLAEFHKQWPIVNALFLAYTAKVRAQGTAGVGTKTDMFFIGPQGLYQLTPNDLEVLKAAHEAKEAAYRTAEQTAYVSLQAYILKTAQEQAQKAPPVSQTTMQPPPQPPQDLDHQESHDDEVDDEPSSDDEPEPNENP